MHEVRPFFTTRRDLSERGNLSVVIERAPEVLSVPATWVCERLGLEQLLVGNQLSSESGAGHILTNAPHALVQRYAQQRWWQTDEIGSYWRSRPGWTTPEELLRWASGHPNAMAQIKARNDAGLSTQYAFSFQCDGTLGHVTVSRGTPLTAEEKAVVEFVGPCLFSAFLSFARQRLAVSITGRERQVIRLASRGYGSQRIADELSISKHTVENHLRQAQHKLGARNRIHLVTEAIRHGLVGTYGESPLPQPVHQGPRH